MKLAGPTSFGSKRNAVRARSSLISLTNGELLMISKFFCLDLNDCDCETI